MRNCDYCGKKIGLFSVMYTWLDKQENLAVHDKCSKEWWKKLPYKMKESEKISQIDFKTLSQNEKQEIFDNFLKEIHKDALYIRYTNPKITIKSIAEDDMIKRYENCTEKLKNKLIKWTEKCIEDIEKDKNYNDKENTLKVLNEILQKCKNEL